MKKPQMMTERQFRAWLIPKLRRFSIYWPQRRHAREAARVEIPNGFTKKGKPKVKVMYKCTSCGAIVERNQIHIDHINPVVDIQGFNTWDEYIKSLFCDLSNLQAICETCHAKKSKKENEERLLKKKKTIATKKKLNNNKRKRK